jgi:tetratricopeptide (TPR) repeat protein
LAVIDELLAPSTVAESPSRAPEFRVNSPAVNPFITPGPIAITRSHENDYFDLEWTEGDQLSPTQASASFIDDVVERSKRDAARHAQSPRAWTNLGSALMGAGQIDEAVGAFERALALDSSHYPAAAHLARVKFLQGELDEAWDRALALGKQFPDDAVAPMMLAGVAVRRGQFDLAIEQLTLATTLDAKSPLPPYLLGMVLLGLRRVREAIARLKAAVRLDSRSPVLQRGLGVGYAASGDLSRAIRAFKTSLALDPNASETAHALGRVLMQHGDVESATQVLSEFVAAHAGDRVAHELLAQSYRLREQYGIARRHLLIVLNSWDGDESSEATNERARLMNNIGVLYASESNFKLAESWYTKSLRVSENSVPFQNLYGVYRELGEAGAARRVLDRWLSVCPDDHNAMLFSAISQADTGDREVGMLELRRLTELESLAPRAYAALGSLLSDNERDLDSALVLMSEAYQRFPGESAIANNLAYVHLMRGEPHEARQVLERVPQAEIADSEYLTATWGLLHLWEGDAGAAIDDYRAAEAFARRRGRPSLAKTLRQKMHLELARHFKRIGEQQKAAAEVKEGLAIRGKQQYRDDLRFLRDNL